MGSRATVANTAFATGVRFTAQEARNAKKRRFVSLPRNRVGMNPSRSRKPASTPSALIQYMV